MITGNENLQSIAEKTPGLIAIFEKQGLGGYFKPENLSKIGRFIKLDTVLKSSGIDAKQFIELLNHHVEPQEKTYTGGSISDIQHQLHFMAMLPCGLQNAFKDFLETHIVANKERYEGLNYLTEGNVNHELSYYPLLDTITSPGELPDIIIASDVNNFFHRPFVERFINKGIFETYAPYTPNAFMEKVGYSDPSGHYTMLTANFLVMAVDKSRLGGRKMPECWEDILHPEFENDIIMRGEEDFFCNAVILPLYKDQGLDAVKLLAHTIREGRHPAEMVKLADSGKNGAATIYIMPYFFAKRIKNSNVQIVWPTDGAITSPVFMLVKKTAMETQRHLLEFLLSRETGEVLSKRLFPSVHPDVDNSHFPGSAKWLGWDFLSQNDIGKLKKDIQEIFMLEWSKNHSKSLKSKNQGV